jgi:hypothetical protein
MRLPNSDQAICDIRKLEDYCLDPAHPRGRHKARVFRDALGIGRNDAAWLRAAFLAAIPSHEAHETENDSFGTRWRVDVPVVRHQRNIVVRTVWMVRVHENIPRFITCWVL